MSRRDLYHDSLRRALEKDNWVITHDPYPLCLDEMSMGIDLGAEKLVAAERDNRRIAVEIKSFTSASDLSAFHTALGQFINYRFALERAEPDRELYLAIPQDAYESFFTINAIQEICALYRVKK